MSNVKLYIHAVFSTKHREPLNNLKDKVELCEHIKMYALDKKIEILAINGWIDHLHILLKLHQDQALSKIMNLIKGESSYWMNRKPEYNGSFAWQETYYAASLSAIHLQTVTTYIDNQEQHHQTFTLEEELTRNSFIAE